MNYLTGKKQQRMYSLRETCAKIKRDFNYPMVISNRRFLTNMLVIGRMFYHIISIEAWKAKREADFDPTIFSWSQNAMMPIYMHSFSITFIISTWTMSANDFRIL